LVLLFGSAHAHAPAIPPLGGLKPTLRLPGFDVRRRASASAEASADKSLARHSPKGEGGRGWSAARRTHQVCPLRARRPCDQAPAPCGAPLRLSPAAWKPLTQLRAALRPAIKPGLQRAPRAGVIVPPGRVPKPPDCVLCVSTPAGAAPSRCGCPHRPPDLSAHLHARLRPTPPPRRLMMAPRGEQGADKIRPVFLEAGITFFREVIPVAVGH
jgi:hypothetical protein